MNLRNTEKKELPSWLKFYSKDNLDINNQNVYMYDYKYHKIFEFTVYKFGITNYYVGMIGYSNNEKFTGINVLDFISMSDKNGLFEKVILEKNVSIKKSVLDALDIL